jgi:hypothetical protein
MSLEPFLNTTRDAHNASPAGASSILNRILLSTAINHNDLKVSVKPIAFKTPRETDAAKKTLLPIEQ